MVIGKVASRGEDVANALDLIDAPSGGVKGYNGAAIVLDTFGELRNISKEVGVSRRVRRTSTTLASVRDVGIMAKVRS